MCQQGEFYDSVLLLLDGTLKLEIGGVEFSRPSASMSDPSSVKIIGTYSFVMGDPMDFSVVAASPVTLRVVDRKTMEFLMRKVM